MSQAGHAHVPVALDRFIELISPALERSGAVFVDATVGLGGHAEAVAKRFDQVRIIGLDRDPTAVDQASKRLAPYGTRAKVIHANFDVINQVCSEQGVTQIDAALFDLGVSSVQLDQDERGFAYSRPTKLDMRMDPGDPLTAAQVLATYPRGELVRVLRQYGQERFAAKIATAIVHAREDQPITTSDQLVELIRQAIPAPARRRGGHPAKRVFQALRVEVNGELAALDQALPQAIDLLRLGGRLVVMSYQSLEDQAVKQTLAHGLGVRAPVGLPVVPQRDQPYLRALTRGAELASDAEQRANPRAAPLRLRAVEKVGRAV